MKNVRLDLVVQSHLSDALIECDFNPDQAKTRLMFVKWLVNKHNGNLGQEVNIDALWDEFKATLK